MSETSQGRLSGVVAVVTGGAQGIGAAHCELFAAEGATVIVADNNTDLGSQTAARIGGTFSELDVASESAWGALVESVDSTFGPIGLLVNSAGVFGRTSVDSTTLEEWNRILDINLTGTFLGIRTVTASMKNAPNAAIINMSSVGGLIGVSGTAPYVASKWAVRGLTKAAALDLSKYGIRVFSVHPSGVDTPILGAFEDRTERFKDRPIPRVGRPEEIARMSLFLAVDATYSTGSEFVPDGGMTAGTILKS